MAGAGDDEDDSVAVPPEEQVDDLAAPEEAEAAPADDRALADEPRNDLGNAARLRLRHGEDLRFVAELARDPRDAWLVWDRVAGVWQGGQWGEAQKRAHQTAVAMGSVELALADGTRARQGEAAALQAEAEALAEELKPEIRKAEAAQDKERVAELRQRVAAAFARVQSHHKWAISSGNVARSEAMLKAATPYLLVSTQALDKAPLLLAVKNGTLELPSLASDPVTGEKLLGPVILRPSRRGDYLTRSCAVTYDPDARAARFGAFLDMILPDRSVQRFLQKWFGYCLTGLTGEQLLLLFYGGGGNGKSTLINIIKGVLDALSLEVPFETFVAQDKKRGGEATPELVGLPGARLVIASEPEVGTKLSEATIKRQTGDDVMTLRPLFQGMVRFLPTHKIILVFNNKPAIRAQDHGTWRRLAMIHFAVTITGPKLPEKFSDLVLREESAGVLNWMLDGYRLWREEGLEIPEAVRAMTAEYRAENDALAEFQDECLEVVEDPEITTAGKTLYAIYELWAQANGIEQKMTATTFGKRLSEKFDKFKSGTMQYRKVKVKPDTVQRLDEQLADRKRQGHGGGA